MVTCRAREFIINAIRRARRLALAVGTEVALGFAARRARSQDTGVEVRILTIVSALHNDVPIDQPHLLWGWTTWWAGLMAGRTGRARIVNQIKVPAKARELALLALERMLELTGPARALATVD